MIDSIVLYKLRNGEYSRFMLNVLKIVSNNDPAALQVLVFFTALQAASAEVERLFKIPTARAITAALQKFDLLRDNALKGIQNIVLAHTYSEDDVLKNHALVLETHIRLFGKNITDDSYQSETSSISNMINDWNTKPELTAAIVALGLKVWMVNLETANNSFDENYVQRSVESGTDIVESLKAKRIEANEAFYTLRNKLNAYYEINEGAEPYKKVVSGINGLVKDYNDTLARRGSGEEGGDDNGEGENEHEGDAPANDNTEPPVA